MDTTTVAHPRTPDTPETPPGYVLRGLGLFELRGDEILRSYQGGGRWIVPSATTAKGLYEGRVGVRPGRSRCECRGFGSHGHCSHIVAAERVSRRSGVCDGCGARVWHRDLLEVGADSLAFFEGDQVCEGCARDHGEL